MTKRVLGLRTSRRDRTSYNGFQWPSSGKVVAPDWDAEPVCGHGLHALLGGIGDGSLLRWEAEAVWQAVWIDEDKIVELNGKVKFPECEIAVDGTREEVIKFMIENGADGSNMAAGIVSHPKMAVANGYHGMATIGQGDYGFAAADGEYGRATANGCGSFATASGKHGRATANGMSGRATADGTAGVATANGHAGKATANGHNGRATANGEMGQATANGERSMAVADGVDGQATANGLSGEAVARGRRGCATANGECGRAISEGDHGMATANGYRGCAVANGEGGKATANGMHGIARASGVDGVATAEGYGGHAFASGKGSRAYSSQLASAGPHGVITITYFDEANKRRVVTGYVGENGIEPDMVYKVVNGQFVSCNTVPRV